MTARRSSPWSPRRTPNEQLGTIAAIFHPKQAMPEARGGHFGHLERGLPWHVYAPIRTLTSDGAPGPLAASAP